MTTENDTSKWTDECATISANLRRAITRPNNTLTFFFEKHPLHILFYNKECQSERAAILSEFAQTGIRLEHKIVYNTNYTYAIRYAEAERVVRMTQVD